MVAIQNIYLILIPFAIILSSCGTSAPKKEDIVGKWQDNSEAIFYFEDDGTFSCKNLPANLFFSITNEYSNETFFSESGKWKIKKSQGSWVVSLNFNRSENLKGGYSTYLLISGSKGLFENKPPWILYVWEGDIDSDALKHKFFKEK